MATNYVAKLYQGTPLMIDHTPSTAVSAGDVVVEGDQARIAHLDIAADRQGALAAGGGVYEVTADALIAIGTKVYWDAAADKVTETVGSNKVFGETITASAADLDKIYVKHDTAL